jgi:hypothetical protein
MIFMRGNVTAMEKNGQSMIIHTTNAFLSAFGGLVVSMLASATQDRGFEPSQSRQIFRVKKSTACLPSEGK